MIMQAVTPKGWFSLFGLRLFYYSTFITVGNIVLYGLFQDIDLVRYVLIDLAFFAIAHALVRIEIIVFDPSN